MGGIRINPIDAPWHDLTSLCSQCKKAMVISEIKGNARGELWFRIICLKCGDSMEVESSLEKIQQHCFDQDFLALMRIKGES